MRSWSTALALTAIASVACYSSAKSADDIMMWPDLKAKISEWSTCRGEKIQLQVHTSLSDQAVVDSAFAECKPIEKEAISLWERHYGKKTGHQLVAIREKWRAGQLQLVQNLRSGASLTDPTAIWGRCVREKLELAVASSSTREAAADSAIERCVPEEKVVEAAYSARHNAADAKTMIGQIRAELRKRAIAAQSE